MKMDGLRALAFGVFCVLGICTLQAQEPGMVMGHRGVRFVEAPGYTHYILPCGAQHTSMVFTMEADALCWPVLSSHVHMVDGKPVADAASVGVLKVTADRVVFLPNVDAETDATPKLGTAGLIFSHKPGDAYAFVGTDTWGYVVSLRPICVGCVEGTPSVDPAKAAQVDAEYGWLGDALNNFDSVDKKVVALSQQTRVTIGEKVEPKRYLDGDVMKKWVDFNTRLADVCAEPAKSCLKGYASFQSCQRAGVGGACGPRPICATECVLPADFDMSEVSLITLPDSDAPGASPAHAVDYGVMGMGGQMVPATPELKALHGTDVLPPPSAAAIMGTPGGVYGPGPAIVVHAAKPDGPARVSGGVIEGNILTKTMPVYPPVARAAHIGGTVVLHAIISKQGTIESLSVVSGPPLLQGSAIDAVKQWTYKPYLVNGSPVEVDTKVVVNFNLAAGDDVKPGSVPVPAAVKP